MILCYRLSSSRYPPDSGKGAAIYGGRWNPVGHEAIYTSDSPSLAALEILVHFSVLPRDFILTPIELPERTTMLTLQATSLPAGWDNPSSISATQQIGEIWLRNNQYLVLDVPSSVVPMQRNFVLNPAHPEFPLIKFHPSSPFQFDPRLK